jgi:hypothetical protein
MIILLLLGQQRKILMVKSYTAEQFLVALLLESKSYERNSKRNNYTIQTVHGSYAVIEFFFVNNGHDTNS